MFSQEEATEIAHIAAIMSDSLEEELNKKLKIGYIETTFTIAKWAVEFYGIYKHVVDWEEQSEKEGVCCWDDVIIKFATNKLNELP